MFEENQVNAYARSIPNFNELVKNLNMHAFTQFYFFCALLFSLFPIFFFFLSLTLKFELRQVHPSDRDTLMRGL